MSAHGSWKPLTREGVIFGIECECGQLFSGLVGWREHRQDPKPACDCLSTPHFHRKAYAVVPHLKSPAISSSTKGE